MELQEKAKLRQSALLDQELAGLRELADRGNAPTNKVLQYRREVEVLIAERGEILARYPQLAALGAHARATEPNELGRAEAVARHYARWLRRTMG